MAEGPKRRSLARINTRSGGLYDQEYQRLVGCRRVFGVINTHSSQELMSWRWWREAVLTQRRATEP